MAIFTWALLFVAMFLVVDQPMRQGWNMKEGLQGRVKIACVADIREAATSCPGTADVVPSNLDLFAREESLLWRRQLIYT